MRVKPFKLCNGNLTWLRYITVEPALIFYATSHVLSDFLNTNLYLQKSCRHNTAAEPDLNTFCDDEKRGITYVSWVNSNFVFVKMILSVTCAILATSWSDEARRRKPLMIIPIVGQMLESTSGCLQSYFWNWSPINAVISSFVIHCSTGGMVLFSTACFVYICEVSSFESRTMRIGIISAIRIICTPISNGFAGFIIREIGFFYSYLMCLVLSVISLFYAFLFIKDVTAPTKKNYSFKDTFKLNKLVENFKIIFKKSLASKRKIVALLLLVNVFVGFSSEGERSLFYLYFRYRFKWNERTFSYYLAYKLIGVLLGTVFCSVILSKVYKIHDGIIGAFSAFWDTVAVLCYFFANQSWQLYLIPLLDIFHGAAKDAYASFLSKFYENHEIGRLSSVVMTFGLIIPVCHPIYNSVFQHTMDYSPSAFFLISVVTDIIVCLLYGYSYFLSRKLSV